MTDTDLAVLGDGAVDAEALQTDTDVTSSFLSVLCACLQCDRGAYTVSPAYVLKADRLDALGDLIGIEAGSLADLARFFNRSDTVLSEYAVDFLYTSVVVFK